MPPALSKQAVVDAVLLRLHAEVEFGTRAALATGAAATDPDSKAENKYDTRNLEASYLARGQAFRVVEAREAMTALTNMPVRAWAPGEAVSAGALVNVRDRDGDAWYLLATSGGGTAVTVAAVEVQVITPDSPLGSKLRGRRAGENFELSPGRPASAVKIAAVQ